MRCPACELYTDCEWDLCHGCEGITGECMPPKPRHDGWISRLLKSVRKTQE